MFKKSLLGAALSIALLQPTVNASPNQILNNPNNSFSENSQEISKYENIINQLKNQLREKVEFNLVLENKLVDAINLSKSVSSDKITEDQANSLNNLIIKLNQNVQENKSENNILENKIKVLEQFLGNYKNHIVNEKNEILVNENKTNELKPESDIKKEVLKGDDLNKQQKIEEAIKESETKVDFKPESPIVKKELSSEDEVKQKQIEKAAIDKKAEFKPESPITKKELSKEESQKIKAEEDKKNGVKTVSPIDIEKLEKSAIKNNDKLLKQAIEEDKTKNVQQINNVEEKTFMEMFVDKLNNLVIWFKHLFGLNDEPIVVPNEEKLTVVPDKKFDTTVKTEKVNVEKINSNENEIKDPIQISNDISDKQEEKNKEENKILYNSFESKAVEHIISSEKAEPLKNQDVKVDKNFNKELESFIQEENKNSEEVPVEHKDFKIDNEKSNESIIIKVDKPDSDIKKTSFNEEQNTEKLSNLSKPLDQVVNYEVKKGDNLSKIIKKHYSLKSNQDVVNKVNEIADFNAIHSQNLIHIGDIIKLT